MKNVTPKILKLREILNLPEIRDGRVSRFVKASTLSYFKNGKSLTNSDNIYFLEKELNKYSDELYNFFSKEVEESDKYASDLLQILSCRFLNLQQVYNRIACDFKPSYLYLRLSYYDSSRRGVVISPSSTLISKYRNFFEQLRFEMLLLSSKIKLK